MKSTIHVFMLIVSMTASQLICSKPASSMPAIDEKKPFDMNEHRENLENLRAIRHAQILMKRKSFDKTLHEEHMPAPTPIHPIKKPARGCSGCSSRIRKLVSILFSYCTATTNDQD